MEGCRWRGAAVVCILLSQSADRWRAGGGTRVHSGLVVSMAAAPWTNNRSSPQRRPPREHCKQHTARRLSNHSALLWACHSAARATLTVVVPKDLPSLSGRRPGSASLSRSINADSSRLRQAETQHLDGAVAGHAHLLALTGDRTPSGARAQPRAALADFTGHTPCAGERHAVFALPRRCPRASDRPPAPPPAPARPSESSRP